MAHVGQIVSSPLTRIVFLETYASSGGKKLVFEETYQPSTPAPPKHRHPNQDEKFTCLSGLLGVQVGNKKMILEPGQSATAPANSAHTLWNAGDEPCVHLVEMTPPANFEDFFESIVKMEAQGRVPGGPNFSFFEFVMTVSKFENYFPIIPVFIQKKIFAILNWVGKIKGKSDFKIASESAGVNCG